jgi:hypothetical protein
MVLVIIVLGVVGLVALNLWIWSSRPGAKRR